ncbi:MAG: hypothetical protein GY923_15250 [Aestuariibacter sp.]|nr:hypothetical protein [Aestuariibacter sp.]
MAADPKQVSNIYFDDLTNEQAAHVSNVIASDKSGRDWQSVALQERERMGLPVNFGDVSQVPAGSGATSVGVVGVPADLSVMMQMDPIKMSATQGPALSPAMLADLGMASSAPRGGTSSLPALINKLKGPPSTYKPNDGDTAGQTAAQDIADVNKPAPPSGAGPGGKAGVVQQAARMYRPPVSNMGLAQSQKELEQELAASPERMEDISDRLGMAKDLRIRALDDRRKVEEKLIEDQGKIRQKALSENQKIEDQKQLVIAEKQREGDTYDEKRTKYVRYNKHALLDPEMVDHYYAIKDDLDIPEEMRAEAIDELERSSKIDPNYNRSIGQRIMAALAMAMSSFGSTLSNTPNHAMQLIRQKREEEVASQKQQFESAGDRLTEFKTSFAKSMYAYDDKIQSFEAAKIQFNNMVQKQLDDLVANAQGPMVKVRYDEMTAKIQEDNVISERKIQQQEKANNARDRAQLIGVQGAIQRGTVQRQALSAKMQASLNKTLGAKKGKMITASAATGVGSWNSAVDMVKYMKEQFDTKIGTFSGVTQVIPATSEKEYNDTRKVAAQVVGGILEGGKLTDVDYPKYIQMFPNPGDSKSRANNKIAALQKLIAMKREGQVSGLRRAGYDVSGFQEKPTQKPAGVEKGKIKKTSTKQKTSPSSGGGEA